MSISWKRSAYYLILLSGVVGLSLWWHQNNIHQIHTKATPQTYESHSQDKIDPVIIQSNSTHNEIPSYVIKVLNHILKYHEAPSSYIGGRAFQNRESNLKSHDANGNKIQYREWDVHPKVKGKNRGAERLITGSDHSAYYTFNHYQTFIKIKP